MGRKLYVGNLPYGVTDSSLEQMFAEHGSVRSAQVIVDRDTGRSKGFGFVARLHDSCMCDPVSKIKFIRACDPTLPGRDGRNPVATEKANSRRFGETLAGRPFCERRMLTDFGRLRYGQGPQFVTFSKGPARTEIPPKTGKFRVPESPVS